MNLNKPIREILDDYISSKIPRKSTNIFWMMFNGFDTCYRYIESYIKLATRERNHNTAQDIRSLQQIASNNGFEAQLKIPAVGKIYLEPTGKLFSKHGSIIYIPPYCEFEDKFTGNIYYYDSPNIAKLSNNILILPVKQGRIETKTFIATGQKLEAFYIDSSNIADGSITVFDNDTMVQYQSVKSFIDTVNQNDNKQFLVKFSTLPDKPIVIYVKETKPNQNITISYRLTEGAGGNINGDTTFQSNDLLNFKGEQISFNDDELVITNYDGFKFGSDGSDMNLIKSAIGFNHGITLLFNELSYKQYLLNHSTLYTQKIFVDESNKVLKHIFVGKKIIYIGPSEINKQVYINSVINRDYLLNDNEFKLLTDDLSDNEFALSSHILYNTETSKYAFQIEFDTIENQIKYSNELELLIYSEFARFLYDNFHVINFNTLISEFMSKHNIIIDFIIFNEFGNKSINISAVDKLPLLKGDFDIYDNNGTGYKLYTDINFITSKSKN